MSDVINKLKQKSSNLISELKNNKAFKIIAIIILVIAIILILFGSSFTSKKNTQTSSTIEQYVYSLEEKLTETLSAVKGAGKVKVVITVESGMETVLAMKTTVTETASGTETVETPILVNGKTVVVKELYPEIVGVLIVAEGADSLSVMSKLQQATVSLLDVNVNQIEILTMK
ncbi:MAG: hypothetical protein IJZ73_06155 [Clostridia bacterium]|nr:hypothetical protein [Clostridia bacterium]